MMDIDFSAIFIVLALAIGYTIANRSEPRRRLAMSLEHFAQRSSTLPMLVFPLYALVWPEGY